MVRSSLLLAALCGCSAQWYVEKTYPRNDTGDTDVIDSADTGIDSDTDSDSTESVQDSDTGIDDSDTAVDTAETGDDSGDTSDTADTGTNDSDTAIDTGDTAIDTDTGIVVDTADTSGDTSDTSDTAIDTDVIDTATDTGYDTDTGVIVDTGDTAVDTGVIIDTGDTADTAVGPIDADGDGWTEVDDCDDSDAAVNPSATEVCDEYDVDEDCSGLSDEDDPYVNGLTTFYLDADGDSYGEEGTDVDLCDARAGFADVAGDCDDGDAAVNPDAAETCATAYDDDCDGDTENGSDTSLWHYDADSDGYGGASITATACTAPAGYVLGNSDCDDSDAAVNPSATETCNSVDDNCDGSTDESGAVGETTWYEDADGDGYGNASVAEMKCDAPTGYVADSSDCDDSEATVNPSGTESQYSVWDDDCDGDDFLGLIIGRVTATSNNLVDAADATFAAGISSSWELVSVALGHSVGDLATSSEAFAAMLGRSVEAVAFFGTGGAASVEDECLVLLAVDGVYAGDQVAVLHLLANQNTTRGYGTSVYLGDMNDESTWVQAASGSLVAASSDGQIVSIVTAGMDWPDVMICGGNVVNDEEAWVTHIAVVTY